MHPLFPNHRHRLQDNQIWLIVTDAWPLRGFCDHLERHLGFTIISLFVLEVQLILNVNISFDTTLYGTSHDPFFIDH